MGWMDYTFSEFHKACENYRRSLKDEDDLEECTIYFNEAETRFLSMKERVALWNESCKMQVGQITQGGAKVRPEDSVSQTSSKASTDSRMSRLSEVMLKTSRKRASLLAEASMMAKHQDLANEEMRLKFEEMRLLQQKQRLHLETEIAKVEAEEKVCTEFATSNEEYCNWGQSGMAQKSIENEALPSRNPCASPWCQPVETESLENGIKARACNSVGTSKFAFTRIGC